MPIKVRIGGSTADFPEKHGREKDKIDQAIQRFKKNVVGEPEPFKKSAEDQQGKHR
jgi:hypothetical protein